MNGDRVSTRELVSAYRSTERPSDAARERMARALAAAVSPPRSATVIPLRPPARRRRTSPAGWLALAAALALIGASSYWLVRAQHEQATGPADLLMAPQDVEARETTAMERKRETAKVIAPALPTSPAAPEPEPASTVVEAAPPVPKVVDETPRRPARPLPRPVAAEPAPTIEAPVIDPVLAELALIQRIEDALDKDQPAEALAAIDAHARSFARGSLAEEREALRVVALCEAGQHARGERARQTFLGAYPRSAYGERVRAACPVAASPTDAPQND